MFDKNTELMTKRFYDSATTEQKTEEIIFFYNIDIFPTENSLL